MIYTVVLYALVNLGADSFTVKQFTSYQLYSIIPIKECTATLNVSQITKEKTLYHVCQTEKLYASMTGQENVEIKTSGVYLL